MLQEILRITHAVLPDEGEDSFALRRIADTAFLCVADGCGGLGSKRYSAMDHHTGAYAASRVAARTFAKWAEKHHDIPQNALEVQMYCRNLEYVLFQALQEAAVQCENEKSRIVGSMQRSFPTTLCALTLREKDICFWWAGDSRGYAMDALGLRQYTADHVRGGQDAFESLYRDAPLSNLLSADQPGRIHARRIHADQPTVAILATDGVYSNLATPMEMEMMLMDTLKTARSLKDWEQKLMRQVIKNAQDDATMLLMPIGFADFDELKKTLLPRREALQSLFVTPVRRHKGDVAYARNKWLQYKTDYDQTEAGHE